MDRVIPLLTLTEAAEALRVSPHTIRSFVRQGRLQPLRLCRRLLFHPDELNRLVALSTTRTPTEAEKGIQVQ